MHSRTILYNTVGNVVSLFVQWLIMMIIPRITNFSEAGVFTVAVSICSMLNIVAMFSMREIHVADQNQCYKDNDFRILRILSVSLSFILVIPISVMFDYSMKQIAVLVAYLVYRNLINYAFYYSASLQIHDRLERVGKDMIIEGLLSFVSFMVSYLITKDLILSTAMMAVIGGGIFLVLEHCAYRKYVNGCKPGETVEKETIIELICIGLPFLITVIVPTIIAAIPKLLLQNMYSDAMAGIFGTLSAPTIVIPTVVTSVFAPFIIHFSNLALRNDMKQIRVDFTKVLSCLLLLGIVAVIVCLLLQEPIFVLLYGEEIRDYTGYFVVMVVAITLFCAGSVSTTILITKKQGKSAAYASMASLVFSLIISYCMISDDGFRGASYSLLLSFFLFGLLLSLCVIILPMKGEIIGNQGQ